MYDHDNALLNTVLFVVHTNWFDQINCSKFINNIDFIFYDFWFSVEKRNDVSTGNATNCNQIEANLLFFIVRN